MDGQWVMMPLYNGGSFNDAWQPRCAQNNYQTFSAKGFGNLQKIPKKPKWFGVNLRFVSSFFSIVSSIPSGPSQEMFKFPMQPADFTRTIRTSWGGKVAQQPLLSRKLVYQLSFLFFRSLGGWEFPFVPDISGGRGGGATPEISILYFFGGGRGGG